MLSSLQHMRPKICGPSAHGRGAILARCNHISLQQFWVQVFMPLTQQLEGLTYGGGSGMRGHLHSDAIGAIAGGRSGAGAATITTAGGLLKAKTDSRSGVWAASVRRPDPDSMLHCMQVSKQMSHMVLKTLRVAPEQGRVQNMRRRHSWGRPAGIASAAVPCLACVDMMGAVRALSSGRQAPASCSPNFGAAVCWPAMCDYRTPKRLHPYSGAFSRFTAGCQQQHFLTEFSKILLRESKFY